MIFDAECFIRLTVKLERRAQRAGTITEQQGPLKAPDPRGDDAAMANREGAPSFLSKTRQDFVDEYMTGFRERGVPFDTLETPNYFTQVAEYMADHSVELQHILLDLTVPE